MSRFIIGGFGGTRGARSCQNIDDNGTVGASPFETNGEQVVFYSPGGQKMGVYCVGWSSSGVYGVITASEEHVYMGARLVGKRIYSQNSYTGAVSEFTADRLLSKGNGSNYYPYGESKSAAAGDDREGFATYTRDGGTGLDYADQRMYASGLGRFLTSDPYVPSSDLNVSSSWNRYGYVDGAPVVFNDPHGFHWHWLDFNMTEPCKFFANRIDGPDDPGPEYRLIEGIY